ncbi:MAG: DUF465 domain-containing protein [Pseudomonadota bacterium]
MSDEKPPETPHGDEAPEATAPSPATTALPPDVEDKTCFAAHDEDFRGANDEAVAIRLSLLEEEHRDLDNAIIALQQNAAHERLSIARLKKKKLALKDRIQELKDAMLPDIIA